MLGPRIEKAKRDFYDLRDPEIGERKIKAILKPRERDTEVYLSPWLAFSKEDKHVYPSQGLLTTPHDYLKYKSKQLLPFEEIVQTLRLRRLFLEMFNHPYRVRALRHVDKEEFSAPKIVSSTTFEYAKNTGLSISIGDLGASVCGSQTERRSRNERYADGPFVKLGRQARSLFVGSASPDVWNSAASISTMAASHCLACIPRNGVTADVTRQADLAREVFDWLDELERDLLRGRSDREFISTLWRKNVCGTLGATPEDVVKRAHILYSAGVRTFRVYSPEPGTGVVNSIRALRKTFSGEIEIFAGMMVDDRQCVEAEEAGADGLYIGIGGGGRCITGVRSGSVIDWPELVWNLRGKIHIPIIVEGGASDHVAATLLLGASGISVSRVVSGGTIESPGGGLYCVDEKGELFKPYGGEASARTKYLDGKLLPFNVPSFVEGETARATKSYVKHALPTLTYNLHLLIEDAILAMVFRNVNSISELQNIDPSPLKRTTSFDAFQRNTH